MNIAESVWEWPSVSAEKDKDMSGIKTKLAIVKCGQEERVAGLSWGMAKWNRYHSVSVSLSLTSQT